MTRTWLVSVGVCVCSLAVPGLSLAAPVVPPCTITGSGTITGTAGPDVICGSDDADAIYGLGGDDVLVGNGGDDTLDGGVGRNTLVGGSGDDILAGSTQNDVFAGGPGTDRVSYANHPTADDVMAFLADSGVGVGAIGFTERDFNGEPFSDGNGSVLAGEHDRIYDDVEGLTGHSGSDTLVGNIASNVIRGGDGNDNLQGYGGDDTIRAGGGRDGVYGQAGNDQLQPELGDDLAIGGDGNDTLYAAAEGDGADDLRGGAGDDLVSYSARTTPTRVSLDNPGVADDGQYNPVAGRPTIERDRLETIEQAITGAGDDVIIGSAAVNTLVSNGGRDELIGGDGVDVLQAGTGDDDVDASGDGLADTVNCGSGVDVLRHDPIDLLSTNCETRLLISPAT